MIEPSSLICHVQLCVGLYPRRDFVSEKNKLPVHVREHTCTCAGQTLKPRWQLQIGTGIRLSTNNLTLEAVWMNEDGDRWRQTTDDAVLIIINWSEPRRDTVYQHATHNVALAYFRGNTRRVWIKYSSGYVGQQQWSVILSRHYTVHN